jgi:hypothetical protein
VVELGAKLAVFLPELVAFGFGGQIGALRNTLLKSPWPWWAACSG